MTLQHHASPWAHRLERAGLAILHWLTGPRVRLTLIGGLLLVLGVFSVSNSLWSLVLAVVGAIMIVTAWVGHRLDGQFGITWGSDGAQFTFRMHVASPRPMHVLPALPAVSRETDTVTFPETIDGEAHTVEIDLEELKSLIAVAEAAEASARSHTTPVVRALRNRRSGSARP